MGKFRQISTELVPFIYVENWFLCSILSIIIFFKLCIRVNRKECYEIANHLIF